MGIITKIYTFAFSGSQERRIYLLNNISTTNRHIPTEYKKVEKIQKVIRTLEFYGDRKGWMGLMMAWLGNKGTLVFV